MKSDAKSIYTLTEYLGQLKDAVFLLSPDAKNNIDKAIIFIVQAIKNNHKIFFCGNGGSASIGEHLVAEFVGRFAKDRGSLPAISLTSNSAVVTSIANDYGYDNVFGRQIEGLGKPGDVLICMSTSGQSLNILKVLGVAKKKGIITVFFTGNRNMFTQDTLDCVILVSSGISSVIQEVHLAIGHYICLQVENLCCD